jgi:hypothetical protein
MDSVSSGCPPVRIGLMTPQATRLPELPAGCDL